MNITELGSIKTKRVILKENLKNELENYLIFLNKRDNKNYQISDLFNALLSDVKIISKIQKEGEIKTSLSLPKSSWDILENVSTKVKLDKNKVIEKLAKGLMKDKSFIYYKKNK